MPLPTSADRLKGGKKTRDMLRDMSAPGNRHTALQYSVIAERSHRRFPCNARPWPTICLRSIRFYMQVPRLLA
jgi:hypothetical protein